MKGKSNPGGRMAAVASEHYIAGTKYRPTGQPITDYEREVLTCLIEECVEVVHAATKLLRFGKETNPLTGVSNLIQLARECGELHYVLILSRSAGLIDAEAELTAWADKQRRLEFYMQTEKEPR